MKRRWPLVLLAVLLGLIGISLVVALVSEREIKGAVPAHAPALGLAAIDDARLVATTSGLFVTRNDLSWGFAPKFGSSSVLVASRGGFVAVRYEGEGRRRLATTSDLENFDESLDDFPLGFAMALGSDGSAYVIDSESRKLFRKSVSGVSQLDLPDGGPERPTALALRDGERLLVGSIQAGLWELNLEERRWRRLVATPARAILIDEQDASRVFLGTVGGLLVSHNEGRSWTFTSLRERVEGVTQDSSRFYALTDKKVVFRSDDGEKNWSAPALTSE